MWALEFLVLKSVAKNGVIFRVKVRFLEENAGLLRIFNFSVGKQAQSAILPTSRLLNFLKKKAKMKLYLH
jgi:hypothetical protein